MSPKFVNGLRPQGLKHIPPMPTARHTVTDSASGLLLFIGGGFPVLVGRFELICFVGFSCSHPVAFRFQGPFAG